MRGWQQTRATNLEENEARYGGKALLRSLKSENYDEKHHHELFRHFGMKNGKVEPTMKKI